MFLALTFIGLVRVRLARYLGRGRQVEVPPVVAAAERLDSDWEIMESQRMMISRLAIENSQKLTEIELLEYETAWLHAVLKAGHECSRCHHVDHRRLSDYDHLRRPPREAL